MLVSGDIESGTTLLNGEKEIGIISSLASVSEGHKALATLSSGCFEPENELTDKEAKRVLVETSSS